MIANKSCVTAALMLLLVATSADARASDADIWSSHADAWSSDADAWSSDADVWSSDADVWWSHAASPTVPDGPVDVAGYRFELHLTDESNRIEGTAHLQLQFTEDGADSFTLDLIGGADTGEGMTVTRVTRAGEPVAFTHRGDRLEIALEEPSVAGRRAAYTIEYGGVPADGLIISTNKFGDRTFFGDNWPNRARNWLPTRDHPSDKARVEWVVTAPDHYKVVANGRLMEEVNLTGPLSRTHWRASSPVPTYVMVIGAAPFAVDYLDEYHGTPVQSWVFPQNRAAGFYDFAIGKNILAFFEGHIGPFPYEKLANVQSKTRFGGMENASAIFYNENAVTGTRSSEELLAHEIAHQWFGDAVTENRWADLWLSEGFATYLAVMYMGFTYGRDSLESLMRTDRRQIIAFAEENPDEPVIDSVYATPIELLNPNSYQKGGWILHMLREQVGTNTFWDILQAFYSRYRDGNAATTDFKNVAEEVSGRELDGFFRQWTRRGGVPALAGDWSYEKGRGSGDVRDRGGEDGGRGAAGGGQVTVTLRQVHDGAPYTLPLEIGLVSSDGAVHVREVIVDERRERYRFDAPRAPVDVVLDPNVKLLMDAQFD